MAEFPIPSHLRRSIIPRRRIANIVFEAFAVKHSTRAPAVGYRITAGRGIAFYVPDVLAIPERRAALRGARLCVGDGAAPFRPIVRTEKATGRHVGHTTIGEQLKSCREEAFPR